MVEVARLLTTYLRASARPVRSSFSCKLEIDDTDRDGQAREGRAARTVTCRRPSSAPRVAIAPTRPPTTARPSERFSRRLCQVGQPSAACRRCFPRPRRRQAPRQGANRSSRDLISRLGGADYFPGKAIRKCNEHQSSEQRCCWRNRERRGREEWRWPDRR
jgi:hypothetical protein